MGKTHNIKQAVKGPKINNVKLFIKDGSRRNLQKKKRKTNNNEHQNTTTITGLQVPDLGRT